MKILFIRHGILIMLRIISPQSFRAELLADP